MTVLNDPIATFALVTIFAFTGFFLMTAVINEQSERTSMRILYFVLGGGLMLCSIFLTGVGPSILSIRSLVTIFAFTCFYFVRAMVIKKNESMKLRFFYLFMGVIMFCTAIGIKGIPTI